MCFVGFQRYGSRVSLGKGSVLDTFHRVIPHEEVPTSDGDGFALNLGPILRSVEGLGLLTYRLIGFRLEFGLQAYRFRG